MRVLLIGPPGSGKGTQATRVAEHFELTKIATGEILREEATAGTPNGLAAKAYMDRGDLVPDDVVIAMARERVGRANLAGGYVLDGYPRTLPQAEDAFRWAAARGVTFDVALFFEVPEAELLRRLAGRAGTEDRGDDREATVRHRLAVFERQTRPLADFYAERGIVVHLDATGPVDAVSERIFAELHRHRADALAAGVDRPEWSLDGPAG